MPALVARQERNLPEGLEPEGPDNVNWLLRARRQAAPLLIGALLGLIAGAAYIASIVPQYTATSVLFVDHRKVRTIQDAYDFPPAGFDGTEATDLSVAAILKSDKILQLVAQKLQLLNDASFLATPPSLLHTLLSFGAARAEEPSVDENRQQNILDRLKGNLSVRRSARTPIIEVSYKAANGVVAARVANAFADAYIADQLDAKYEATRRAASWLSDRLEDLKRGVIDADLALQRFKTKMAGRGPVSNEAMATMRELESKSATHRTLYATFLQKYQETVQQESFPIADARVLSSARDPGAANNQPTLRLLALSVLLGGLAGAGIGAVREFRDKGFRTSNQIRSDLGLELLGMLPLVSQRRRRRHLAGANGAEPPALEYPVRHTQPAPGILGHVVEHPESHYSETLGSVKVALDLVKLRGSSSKLIGITSVFPSEGKSTTAKNLGSLLASLGSETLLIDADLRNRGLSRSVVPEADQGIWDAVVTGKPLNELVVREPGSRLAILPASDQSNATHTSELLTSPGMSALLEQADQNFSHVIIDLPPLGLFVDARALAPQIDAFIIVVEWGRSERKIVQDMLAREQLVRDKCLGIVLNKTNFEKLKLYEDYGSREYHLHKYASSRRYRDARA